MSSDPAMPPIIIVEAPRRLDAAAAPAFGAFVLALIEAGAHRVVLDFAAVTYMGSAGLRAVVLIRKALTECEGHLALMECRAAVGEVFRIGGLITELTLVDNIEEARQSV